MKQTKFIAFAFLLTSALCLFLLGMYTMGYISKFRMPTVTECISTIAVLLFSLFMGFGFYDRIEKGTTNLS